MSVLQAAVVGVAGFAWDHARGVLLAVVAFVVLCLAALPFLAVDPSLEGLLGHDAPENVASAHVKQLFGTDETIVVVVTAPDVFDPDILHRVVDLRADLATNVPYVVTVQSLVDAPLARRQGERLHIGGVLLPWPENEEDVAERISVLAGSTVYRNILVDDAHTLLAVVMTLPPPPDGELLTPPKIAAEAMDATRAVLDRHKDPAWHLLASGKVAIPDALGRTLPKDIVIYGLAATLLSALFLWARFRRVSGVVLPLLVTIPPVVGTLGCMAVLGVPLQLPSTVLPPLVVVISVAGVVHVLSDLDTRVGRLGWGREAVLATLNDKAEALVVAALTTAVGMLSLAFTPIEPAAVVGRFGTLAALLGLLSTLLVVPAWFRLMPWTPRVPGPSVWGGPLRFCAGLATRHSTVIVALSVLSLAVCGAVDARLSFGHDPIRWLPATWDARQGVALLDERMHITMDLDVVVETGTTDGTLDPQSVRQLRALQESVRGLGTGPTRSLVDHLDDTRALLDDPGEYTDDATGRRRLDRHLRLLRLSAGPVMDGLITPDGRYLRLLIRTDFVDASAYPPLIHEVQVAAERDLAGKPYFVAGMLPMFAATLAALSASASIAWPLAVLGGAVLMVLIARSGTLGLLLLIPNLLPPAAALAALRVAGLPLDIFTLLTVSLAMGVVVDDSIHLVTTFRQRLVETPDPDQACAETLQAAGPPIVLTTVLLVSGWLTLLLSPMPGLWMFALVSSGTLAVGLVADLLLTPAVVLFWARHLRR